jgi:hypothetical protein
MNGDFLALLPKPQFPQLGPNAPALEPLQATTVFAFHCAEGVIIAGDHRATAGNIVFSDGENPRARLTFLDGYRGRAGHGF